MCISEKELQQTVEELRKLKMMREEINDMIKSEENKIIEFMDENKLDKKRGNDFKITYKQITRSYFDKDLLIPVLGDNIDMYQKQSQYMQLRVS